MKKIISLFLILCLALSLVACGGAAGGSDEGGQTEPKAQFKAGFGMADVTPDGSVPLASYGDSRERMSTGMYSFLEARAVAIQDENGDLLLFITGDLSWIPNNLGTQVRTELAKELGIPENHILLSGTHTHAGVDTSLVDIPTVVAFNNKFTEGLKQCARDAIADLKPAQVYVGSVMTEGLTFVKNYIMDDGSHAGDNFFGTGTTYVGHDGEADQELQMMKFVREGGKDILIAQFQAHPHLEGKTTNFSAQLFGYFRDAVERDMDIHCLAWNGAAGNLNSNTRIPEEQRTTDRNEWAQILCDYAKSGYDSMTQVQTGPIKVADMNYVATINHAWDDYVDEAYLVQEYYDKTRDDKAAAFYAESLGLYRCWRHARAIPGNAARGATEEIYMHTWSFGEVSGVVLPYEMFCQTGMNIKAGSPFTQTFIVGYSWPSYTTYIPTKEAFEIGGYEVGNCHFVAGTAEEMEAHYLELLRSMHE